MSDLERAESILRDACDGRLHVGFPMAPLTSFRIGGPAALYLEPESEVDLAAAGRAMVEGDIPVVVLGKGSNVLVADAGFAGLVLRLGRSYRWGAREGEVLVAGAAMPLPALSGIALHHGLSGLEFGVAIPATVGGAVRMNAGAHGHELAEVVESVEVFRLHTGEPAVVPAAGAGFEYRGSDLGEDAVVVGTRLRLTPEDPRAIRQLMDEVREWRRRTQPLAEPNCGSVFTNPPGDHAARLIEAAGGKGRRIGGASVSTKHANFIVAAPGARASDVAALIEEIRTLVADRAGVVLEPEVRLIGAPA